MDLRVDNMAIALFDWDYFGFSCLEAGIMYFVIKFLQKIKQYHTIFTQNESVSYKDCLNKRPE